MITESAKRPLASEVTSEKETESALAKDFAFWNKELSHKFAVVLDMINNGKISLESIRDKGQFLDIRDAYIQKLTDEAYRDCIKKYLDGLPPYSREFEKFAQYFELVTIDTRVPGGLVSLVATGSKNGYETKGINSEELSEPYTLLIRKNPFVNPDHVDLSSISPQREVKPFESLFVRLKYPGTVIEQPSFSIDKKGDIYTHVLAQVRAMPPRQQK
jgi:hypothetical protein